MDRKPSKHSCCQKMSFVVVGGLEKLFYRYGYAIGCHPWRFIFGCLCLVVLSSFGVMRFRQEKYPMKLWIPPNSEFARDTEWLVSEFGEGIRFQTILVTAPDVLQSSVLAQLGEIHQKVMNISADGITWEDVCFRIPIVDFNLKRRKRQTTENGFDITFDEDDFPDWNDLDAGDNGISEFDPSVFLDSSSYCSIVNSLKIGCLQHNILDLWKYDLMKLKSLSKTEIVNTLNTTTVSPVLGHPMNYMQLLGDVKRNTAGQVESATALLSLFIIHVNFSIVNMDESGNEAGTEEWATGPILAWEKQFLNVMANASTEVEGMRLYYESGRSYGDISASGMFQDMDKLAIGIIMMFVYVQIIISKWNMVEVRIILGSIGLASVGLAFIVACGLCSLAGIFYGPVHTALPFLLLGIGVDDMFVIMSGWNNLNPTEKQMTLPEKIGRMMKHAGPSITITSVTDVVAFLVGSLTILPSLQSFCLYAAAGVLVTYLFQATLLVACLVLDQKRIDANRNALVCCYKHTNYKPNNWSQIDYSRKYFGILYSKVIFTVPGKVIIILLTMAVGAVSTYGTLHLKQKFDPAWFLAKNSHLYSFIEERTRYYPDLGKDAAVYMGRLNYSQELPKIDKLIKEFKQHTQIVKDVENWYDGFRSYLAMHYDKDIPNEILSDTEFSLYISKYLFSPHGAKYQKNFRFNGKLSCGNPAPPVTVASFDFKFKLFDGPEESLPAMNRVKALVKEANFSTGDQHAIVWGKIFSYWVTDEVIDKEVIRNLGLACMCVMLCTAILIINFVTCFLVFICVLLTLLNVAGMMYFWGLTIDVVSCIALQLAAGLCVDYAAHIGHTFLSCSGSRGERAMRTVVDIGPAIMSGGISTLIALSVLITSQSYIFVSFFKIFLLVVIFGLYHGLVFLPVVLSWIGPLPYPTPHSLDVELQTQTIKTYKLCDAEIEKLKGVEKPS